MISSLLRAAMAPLLALMLLTLPSWAYESQMTSDSNVYNAPKKSAQILGTIKAGGQIEVLRCKIFWCEIKQGRLTGWVQAGRLAARDNGASAEREDRGGGGGGGNGNAGNAGGIGTAGSGAMIWGLISSIFGN